MTDLKQCKLILIIDDSMDFCDIIEPQLTELGYTVEVASTGRHGIERLKRCQEPCLILLDYFMPGMRGDQLVEQLASLQLPVEHRVLYVTGSLDDLPLPPGVVGILRKPFPMQTLVDLVQTYCESPPPRSGLQPSVISP